MNIDGLKSTIPFITLFLALFTGIFLGVLLKSTIFPNPIIEPMITIATTEESELLCVHSRLVDKTMCFFPGKLSLSGVAGTGSMRPTIQDNSILLSSAPPDNAWDLEGRIILYTDTERNKSIVHRCILALDDSTCIEHGDNNDRSFGEVNLDQIHGVVEWVITPQ